MAQGTTWWDRTKQYSNTAYERGLKPGFNKAYSVVNKLEAPVNKLSNKVGAEAFWPSSLDKESDKAARILRSFCKDGVYDDVDEEIARQAEVKRISTQEGVPLGKQRVIKKIPASVIQNAKGLAIFTTMRFGWIMGGAGGGGLVIGRHPDTGEWSPPSGIHVQNLSVGFLGGADILDTVLVINTYEALAAFTKFRATLGTEVAVAAGPFGIGGTVDTQISKKPAPVWAYVKSRGLYGGIGLDGNVIIERVDENARFYGDRVPIAKILRGEVHHPPLEKYRVLINTVRAAQGEPVADELLPDGLPPSEMEVASPPATPTFGVPQEDDEDPFGVKALEKAGLSIREAGTHRKASPESFEFRPSPTSPVYRQSTDSSLRRAYRSSLASVSSMTRGTQTDEDEPPSATRQLESPIQLISKPPLPPRQKQPEIDMAASKDVSVQMQKAVEEGSPGEVKEKVDGKRDVQREEGVTNDPGEELNKENEGANGHIKTTGKSLNSAPKEAAVPLAHEEETQAGGDKDETKTPDERDDADDEGHNTDSNDDYSDFESDIEISTAVPVTTRPKAGVVDVPKRVPPTLPTRNPGRTRTPIPDEGMDKESDNGPVDDGSQRHEESLKSKAEDESRAHTPQPYLKVGTASTVEDEFHSVPPSPAAEKELAETITSSAAA